jgi:F420-0:gamma-glutamyl ligase-like protein
MAKYKVSAVTTEYWRPRREYLEEIANSVAGKVEDGDFVVISEKAISTASGNIIDESKVNPNLNAKLIARCWMPIVWGHFLGILCHFRAKLLQRLRAYPEEMGSRHKQVTLWNAGLLQTLMFGSEGGIDGSNLAYSYVSLPLRGADEVAEKIRVRVLFRLQKKTYVMIVDTDKTYSFGSFHFTPRPHPIAGIHSYGGFITYVIGRACKLNKRATPIAVAGCKISVEEALEIAEAANRARGYGSGKTVWDMAERFSTDLAGVSWEMLETVKHKPIVVVKRRR